MAIFRTSFRRWLRQLMGPAVREMSRTGKIVQTLWDAAQLQALQRDYYYRMGEIALQLIREGKLQNIALERLQAKLERSERILRRQEAVLRGFQSPTDLREIIREDRQAAKDGLETEISPVNPADDGKGV